MAPSQITEDYYTILEVKQTASPEELTKSYRRLALALHPDRNRRHDATEAFQLLGRAFETLKDPAQRRSYDFIYPGIVSQKAHSEPNPPKHQPETPRTRNSEPSKPTSKDPREDALDRESIETLRKVKSARDTKWRATAKKYDDAIFELQRDINKLRKAIEDLDIIKKAEDAEEAGAQSWPTWIIASLYSKAAESEDEKARKANERLQRLHTKNLKERTLDVKMEQMRKWQKELRDGGQDFGMANTMDDIDIASYESRIHKRAESRRQERAREEYAARQKAAREEKERRDRANDAFWKSYHKAQEKVKQEKEEADRKAREEQMQQQVREEAERQKRRNEESRKTQQKRWEESGSSRSRAKPKRNSTPPPMQGFGSSTCIHDGWWPKVEAANAWSRLACEECSATYSYLLQCPGCKKTACATCQQRLRPVRNSNGRAGTKTRPVNIPRKESANPQYEDYVDDYF